MTADFFGLADRGRLQPGLRADVNVIDFQRLQMRKPELVHDMPANGRRSPASTTSPPTWESRRVTPSA